MAEVTRVRRCHKCVNQCELTEPKCVTGRELAKEKGIYETVQVEEKGLFARLFKRER